MKRTLLIFTLILISLALSFPSRIFAQTSTAPQQINARILPLVWYSTLSINEGDSIKIYAGIQNNSGISFSGTATFYVDDKEISKSSFVSPNDSLKDVSTDWVTSPGSHDVQVKITTSLPADKILVSYESDKSNVNIVQKITPELIGTTVLSAASNIISKTDNLANALADHIESFKKPVDVLSLDANSENSKTNNTKVVSSSGSQTKSGSVLGASTGPVSNQNTKIQSAFNIALDALAFLVRNWMWTLGGIILLFLIIKFKK